MSVIGGEAKEYQILICPAKMQRCGVSLQEIRDAVTNMNSNASGGVIYEHGNEYLVKADMATTSLDELANSIVVADSTRLVRLSDVAEVRVGGRGAPSGHCIGLGQ